MREFIVSIPKLSNDEGVVHYFVHVNNHGNEWIVRMRYSQLAQLHEEVVKFLKRKKDTSIVVPHFPPKKWWATQDANFLNSRRVQLEEYLQSLVKQPNIIFVGPVVEAILKPQPDNPESSQDESTPKNSSTAHREKRSDNQHHSPPPQQVLRSQSHNKSDQQQVQPEPQVRSMTSKATAASTTRESNSPKKIYQPNLNQATDDYTSDEQRMSFSQISMARKQVTDMPSFSEEIPSIRRRSFDQLSDSENSSSFLFFFQQPPIIPYRQSIHAQSNPNSIFPSDQILFRSSGVSKASMLRIEQVESTEPQDMSSSSSSITKEGSSIQPIVNQGSQQNLYSQTLEQYQATQRTYKHEIEKINESNEMSSIIEQDVFFDSEDDEESKQDFEFTSVNRQQKQEVSESLPNGFRSSTSIEKSATTIFANESAEPSEEQTFNNSHILRDLSLNSLCFGGGGGGGGGGSPVALDPQQKSLLDEINTFQRIKLSVCQDEDNLELKLLTLTS